MTRRTVLALVFGTIACGGPAGSGFVATWNVSSGTTQIACGPLGGSANEQGTFGITQNGSQLTSTFSAVTCQLEWTVATGSTATLLPNQSCTLSAGGVTTEVTFGTGSATLLNSNNLSVDLAGSGPLTDGGAPSTCTTSISFTAN